MTDETKKLFSAPWEARIVIVMSKVGDEIRVVDARKYPVATCDKMEDAARIARLPELYDALMYFVVNDCPHAFISNDECRLCPDKECKTREAVELLRKVRDGE